MKVFFVLAALVAVGSASSYHHGETGSSNQFRNEDNAGGFQFGYDEQHTSGGSFRREARDAHGATSGSYGLTDADGRQRIVHYIADAAGFRAQVQTNEPGVEASNPADVAFNKAIATVAVAPAPVRLAPAPVHLAPLAPLPAPLQLAAPIGVKSYSYSSSPLRATFGPAPVDSYAVKQVGPLPVALPVPQFSGPLAAPLPAPFPAQFQAQLGFPTASPIYNQHIEQAHLLAPEPATPRAFSYSFGSSHLAPVAVKAPTFVHQANYVQQQTQDY